MEDDQQFCLRWNNHQSTLISVFDTLLENGTLVDCTLAAEGKFLKAHKVVLSACSPYFATLLTQQYDKHPVFILKDVKFQELRAMMDYMYRGEVNISQDQLAALLRAAESLQIKGLSDNRGGGGGGGGSSSSGGDSGSKSENAQKPIPVPVVSKPGLTIEQKRPNKHPAIDADLCESREGSTSPTSRKRKKIRRRSTETNNLVDNHDQLSNSSSQSMPHHHQQQQQQQQTKHMTSSVAPLPQITSATSAANVLNVTKKTDIHEPKKELDQSMQQEVADDDDDDDDQNEVQEQPVRRMKTQHHDIDMSHLKEKMESTHSELLIEPKSEYDDGNDETVEDLTLDEEELLEDLDQAGPSHGGEGSSQGYAQWQVDRSQDEVFLAAQEAAGQHRDAQGINVDTSEVIKGQLIEIDSQHASTSNLDLDELMHFIERPIQHRLRLNDDDSDSCPSTDTIYLTDDSSSNATMSTMATSSKKQGRGRGRPKKDVTSLDTDLQTLKQQNLDENQMQYIKMRYKNNAASRRSRYKRKLYENHIYTQWRCLEKQHKDLIEQEEYLTKQCAKWRKALGVVTLL